MFRNTNERRLFLIYFVLDLVLDDNLELISVSTESFNAIFVDYVKI